MVHTQNPGTPASEQGSLALPMMIGAGIALAVISLFVFGADNPDPAWGKFWMIRPLIITPLAGATGGAFFYFMNQMRVKGKMNGVVAIILSVLVYIIGLWLGIVLGLDGTMWN
ncbi:MAG: potassium transporter KefB [Bacteroidota bacterium]